MILSTKADNQLNDATKINIFPECLQNYRLLRLLPHLFLTRGGGTQGKGHC